jgi:ABC-type transport system substrate-binding protein
MIAKAWEFDLRSNTYRFHLHEGVRFHDRSELTANDVKYTFDIMIAGMPDNHQQLGTGSIKVVAPYTLDITPEQSNRQLVEQLVHPVWGIYREDSDPLEPNGCGPYRFSEYVRGEHLAVERFDHYWNHARTGAARHIDFLFTTDTASRINAIVAGDIDLAMDIGGSQVNDLEDVPEVKVVRSTVGAYNALTFNIAGLTPYDLGKDPSIREAVALGINREVVRDVGWGGNTEDGRTWIPRPALGKHSSRVRGVTFDPERARQLLDRAGWTSSSSGDIRTRRGRRLTLLHVLGGAGDSDPRDSRAAARVISEQLLRIGIETRLDDEPSEVIGTGHYDLYQGVANQNEAYPGRLPDIIHYSKKPGSQFRAPGGKTDDAIERCRASSDREEAQKYAAEAAHQLVDVEHVIVPLAGIYRIWALRNDLAGFVPHPSRTNQRWEGVHRTG